MEIWKNIQGEFIDVIQWTFEDEFSLAHRFERHDHEIKMGATLVVREGQNAIFVNEGKLADVFGPGTYTLSTRNLPVLSTLQGWKHLFESPFKAEVYFINTIARINRKWGTSNPILLRDQELGVVRIRSFGLIAWQIEDARRFFESLVGTAGHVDSEDLDAHIKGWVVEGLSEVLGAAKISAFDLATHYLALADQMRSSLTLKFSEFGLRCLRIVIENISLPPEVEAVVDKRTGMAIAGDMTAYLRFNVADKAGEALAQPGGMAGALAGAGAGLALGRQMAGEMEMTPSSPGERPPPMPRGIWHVSLDGKAEGPFDEAGLKRLTDQGRLRRETLVWKSGSPEWKQAVQVPELAVFWAHIPPPLPA